MIKYVKSIDELTKETEARGDAKDKAIDYLSSIGIDVKKLPLPQVKDSEITVALARQVPTCNLEHVIVDMLAAENVGRIDLAFGSDHYVSNNPDKSSRVKLKLLDSNGKIVGTKIANPNEGSVLKDIQLPTTLSSIDTLPKYHEHLLKMGGSKANIFDVSHTYSVALEQSLSEGHMHDIVWVNEAENAMQYIWNDIKKEYKCNGSEKTVDEIIHLASGDNARPDVGWYYPNLHLMMPGILIPTLAYVETPWEGDDRKIYSTAAYSHEFVEQKTGVQPLVVPVNRMESLEEAKIALGTKHPSYVITRENPNICFKGSGSLYNDSIKIEEALINYVKSRRAA